MSSFSYPKPFELQGSMQGVKISYVLSLQEKSITLLYVYMPASKPTRNGTYCHNYLQIKRKNINTAKKK